MPATTSAAVTFTSNIYLTLVNVVFMVNWNTLVSNHFGIGVKNTVSLMQMHLFHYLHSGWKVGVVLVRNSETRWNQCRGLSGGHPHISTRRARGLSDKWSAYTRRKVGWRQQLLLSSDRLKTPTLVIRICGHPYMLLESWKYLQRDCWYCCMSMRPRVRAIFA